MMGSKPLYLYIPISFSKLDDNNTVLTTIVVSDEDAPTEAQGQVFLENIFGWAANKWKQTSYNTYDGIHYQADRITPSVDQSKALRANFAGAGMIYNEEHDWGILRSGNFGGLGYFVDAYNCYSLVTE